MINIFDLIYPFCYGIWGLRSLITISLSLLILGLNPFCFGVWGLREDENLSWMANFVMS